MGTFYRYLEFLRFDLSNRSFCVDVDQVLGVITLPPKMKVPPSTIPFNDEELEIFALEKMLNIDESPDDALKEIIILKGPNKNYGILVTLIGEIYKVPIQRAVFRFPNSDRSQIKMFGIWGMAVLGQELALILEPYVLIDRKVEEPHTIVPSSRTSERQLKSNPL